MLILLSSPVLSTQGKRLGVRYASFFWKLLNMSDPNDVEKERKLYNWDDSPYEDIRTRAAFIRTQAACPVTNLPVNYVCPYSGIPTHHSREAWEKDTDYHEKRKYDLLKKVNLYEHDLRSGRKFDELNFPGEQPREFATNLSSWDSFFYTRDFAPMNTEFNLAAATKVLTYPMTIAAILQKFSPYKGPAPNGPLTLEGMRSLAALRYTLYESQSASTSDLAATFKERPMRIFILGAKMESMLPGFVWKQFGYLFPDTKFEIHLVGPEAYFDRETRTFGPTNEPNGNAKVVRADDQLTFHYHTNYFHELYNTGDLFPFDPYLDVFFMFHPGFQTADYIYWDKALKGLLDSKCAVFVTGYHEKDLAREIQWLEHHPLHDEMDVLMNPTDNVFECTKLDLVDTNPTETFNSNCKLFAFRGKRYYAIKT